VLLVVAVGALAAYNHWALLPEVRSAAAGEGDGEARATTTLTRTVRAEVVGLLAVVAVTAALVNLAPARNASGGVVERTTTFGDGSAVVLVDPAKRGDNTVHVYLLDDIGRQLELTEPPTFSFTLSSQDIGPIERTPWRAGPGHYIYDGPGLSLRGTWTVEIRGRTSTFDEATATVQVPVR
jgi:copper transport protein